MLPECPEDLRYLLPYLQRASELKSREPVIAYYCGFYAANMALTRGYPRNKDNDAFLGVLFDELEQEKGELKDETAMQDQEQGKMVVLQFAMRIFLAADNEDRAGQATKKTGRLFLVASQFLEVARVFADLTEEIEERIKYAKWKAADIVKAINEGKKPNPGPPNASPPRSETGEVSPSPVDVPGHLPSLSGQVPPTSTQRTTSESPPIILPPLNIPVPVVVASPGPPTVVDQHPPVSPILDPVTLSVAEKYARYAVSAIQFEDVSTAIENLQLCIDTLRDLKGERDANKLHH